MHGWARRFDGAEISEVLNTITLKPQAAIAVAARMAENVGRRTAPRHRVTSEMIAQAPGGLPEDDVQRASMCTLADSGAAHARHK